jgi:hypothetical protein
LKVAVIGSRGFPALDRVEAWIEKLAARYPDATVVSGGAPGVDIRAEGAALANGLSVISYRVENGCVYRYEIDPFDVGGADQGVVTRGAELVEAAPMTRNVPRLLKWRNGPIVEEGNRVVAFALRQGGPVGYPRATFGTQDALDKAAALGRPRHVYWHDTVEPDVFDESAVAAELVREFGDFETMLEAAAAAREAGIITPRPAPSIVDVEPRRKRGEQIAGQASLFASEARESAAPGAYEGEAA